MTKIAVLAAILLATLPLRAEAQMYNQVDDAKAAHLSTTALATADDPGRGTGHEADEGRSSSERRLKAEEIESIISNLQQTRSELQAQIENQRRQMVKLEADIARILDYVKTESLSQSASENCQPVTSPEMQPPPDSVDSSPKLSETNVTDQGEGWIRNENTGETVSLRQGEVAIADRSGRPIDRPTRMLTTARVHAPGEPLRVGNLDVTFSPNVSRRVKMAFLHYHATPTAPTQRYEVYANTPKGGSSDMTRQTKKVMPIKLGGISKIRKIGARHHLAANNDSTMVNQRPDRLVKLIDFSAEGQGEWSLRLPIGRNRVDHPENGSTAGICKQPPGNNSENRCRFHAISRSAKNEPHVLSKKIVGILKLQDELVNPQPAIEHKVEIASILHSLES